MNKKTINLPAEILSKQLLHLLQEFPVFLLFPQQALSTPVNEECLNIVGPKKGFSQVGALVSMMVREQ